jgi:hypothetical protein
MKETMMAPENRIRGYAYLVNVLLHQQQDPFCRMCKAHVNTADATREELAVFEQEHAAEIHALPTELQGLFSKAASALAAMVLPENATGQKKAGNCKLPEGVCLVKSARGLVQKV